MSKVGILNHEFWKCYPDIKNIGQKTSSEVNHVMAKELFWLISKMTIQYVSKTLTNRSIYFSYFAFSKKRNWINDPKFHYPPRVFFGSLVRIPFSHRVSLQLFHSYWYCVMYWQMDQQVASLLGQLYPAEVPVCANEVNHYSVDVFGTNINFSGTEFMKKKFCFRVFQFRCTRIS